jgi:hypothetical protein
MWTQLRYGNSGLRPADGSDILANSYGALYANHIQTRGVDCLATEDPNSYTRFAESVMRSDPPEIPHNREGLSDNWRRRMIDARVNGTAIPNHYGMINSEVHTDTRQSTIYEKMRRFDASWMPHLAKHGDNLVIGSGGIGTQRERIEAQRFNPLNILLPEDNKVAQPMGYSGEKFRGFASRRDTEVSDFYDSVDIMRTDDVNLHRAREIGRGKSEAPGYLEPEPMSGVKVGQRAPGGLSRHALGEINKEQTVQTVNSTVAGRLQDARFGDRTTESEITDHAVHSRGTRYKKLMNQLRSNMPTIYGSSSMQVHNVTPATKRQVDRKDLALNQAERELADNHGITSRAMAGKGLAKQLTVRGGGQLEPAAQDTQANAHSVAGSKARERVLAGDQRGSDGSSTSDNFSFGARARGQKRDANGQSTRPIPEVLRNKSGELVVVRDGKILKYAPVPLSMIKSDKDQLDHTQGSTQTLSRPTVNRWHVSEKSIPDMGGSKPAAGETEGFATIPHFYAPGFFDIPKAPVINEEACIRTLDTARAYDSAIRLQAVYDDNPNNNIEVK